MTKSELKKILQIEVDKYASKGYDESCKLDDHFHYSSGSNNKGEPHFEFSKLEINKKYIHIMLAVHDNTFIKSIHPISWTFLVYKDGRIEK